MVCWWVIAGQQVGAVVAEKERVAGVWVYLACHWGGVQRGVSEGWRLRGRGGGLLAGEAASAGGCSPGGW